MLHCLSLIQRTMCFLDILHVFTVAHHIASTCQFDHMAKLMHTEE